MDLEERYDLNKENLLKNQHKFVNNYFKIDTSNIPSFLNSLRNSDGGYGSSVGAPSTLESTWYFFFLNLFKDLRILNYFCFQESCPIFCSLKSSCSRSPKDCRFY